MFSPASGGLNVIREVENEMHGAGGEAGGGLGRNLTLRQDPRVVPAPGSYKGSANWARDTPLGPDFIGTDPRAAACFFELISLRRSR